jgi:hypothetical protein
MKKMTKTSLALLAMLGGIISQSQAQLTAVTSPTGLPTTDSIDWGQLGATSFTTISSPAAVVSGGGLNATVSDGSTLERRDEADGWNGNFTPGDHLLWNQGGPGNIAITFASPIFGGGAYIASDDFGSFVATLTAYDGSTLLGSESFNGVNNTDNDGSAIFAGVDSTLPITELIFGLANTTDNDFAIDTLDLNTTNGVAKLGVPDAGSTSLLFGMASLGLGIFRRKLAKS